MKKKIAFFLFMLPLIILSQEFIKGNLITSDSFKKQFPLIEVGIENSNQKTIIDATGDFNLKIEKAQQEYTLNFYHDNKVIKVYTYIHSWLLRKKPKSIVLVDNCKKTNKKKASSDWKNRVPKLYIYQKEQLSRKDIRTQKKYNFSYIIIDKEVILDFDCYVEYNRKILSYLILAKKIEINRINKNTIGKDKFYTWICNK